VVLADARAALLQGMSFEHLEKYLGLSAAAVKEIKALKSAQAAEILK
jgi:hypothetical protein